MKKYDCIVIGAGHAGIEAAHASAKLGCSTLLVTLSLDTIGKLSCNPAVGGVSKGHLVRETDALGGLIGKLTDTCAISYRILNRSKGKAVWATRAQVDMDQYSIVSRSFLEETKNLTLLQAHVSKLLTKQNKICGIETNFSQVFCAKTVIVTVGTFLKSTIHIGMDHFPGGRLSECSSDDLFASIKKLKISTKHFKTGTCARLDRRSLDFSKMEEQKPDLDVQPFSFTTKDVTSDQVSCFITYTNKKTHKIILNNLARSPLYTGKIKACGVRYCPSLEDKIVKFKEHQRHHIFIEPQGRSSIEIYPNGLSTSLPFDVQRDFINSIPGLEDAVILRPGYGIEHGVIDAKELFATLESQRVQGLYFAGQVNGTTGYEEAAAQGIVAGVNAAFKVKKKKPFIIRREQAFIGVLIDDLTSKGTDEPYRMFTSRSEFRMSLRESNAALRLGPLAFEIGLLDKKDYESIMQKKDIISKSIHAFKLKKVMWEKESLTLAQILKRPHTTYENIQCYCDNEVSDLGLQREIETEIKYEGFLNREKIWLKELKNLDRIKIPRINFSEIPSLSKEVIEKLDIFRPQSLGEALRISGITPAAILIIYNYIKQKKQKSSTKSARRDIFK